MQCLHNATYENLFIYLHFLLEIVRNLHKLGILSTSSRFSRRTCKNHNFLHDVLEYFTSIQATMVFFLVPESIVAFA